jgi:hypothetical protein
MEWRGSILAYWEKKSSFLALFAWLISHQPAVLFSHNKPTTRNQSAVFFSQNKSASATSQMFYVAML